MATQRAPAPLEHDIQNAIVDYLRMRSWFVLRLNAGVTVIDQPGQARRVMRGLPAGTPDVLAIKGGHTLFIEVKRPGSQGRVTDKQRAMMATLEAHGARCLVATSVEDVQRAGV